MKVVRYSLLVFFVLFLVAWFNVDTYLDKKYNTVVSKPPYEASPEAKALHQSLWIADLHADSLLWNRAVYKRHDYGHVDIPRLQEAGVALQVFDAVIKVPSGLNYEGNDGSSDQITQLAMANRWPVSTYNSLVARATYQAEKLHAAVAKSDGQFRIVRSGEELVTFVEERKQDRRLVAGMLGVEGLQALEGRLENIDVLYDAGYRVMGLVHLYDNKVAGSNTGMKRGGLTPFGREVVQTLVSKRMIIDLAHASGQTIRDVMAMVDGPVVVSHTGVMGTHESKRNLSDEQIRLIATKGGLIGIGYWDSVLGEASVPAIVKAMQHTVSVGGIDCVGLGSDFDGTVHTPWDTTGLVQLTEGLLEAGFSAADIAKIMGGNQLRVFRQILSGPKD